jgi:threonine synthase
MARVYRDSGVVVDPHSAVAVHAARAALKRDPETPVISLATAHPAKFPEAVESAIGHRPELPPHLAEIQSRRERFAILANDPAAVAKFVRERTRVAA